MWLAIRGKKEQNEWGIILKGSDFSRTPTLITCHCLFSTKLCLASKMPKDTVLHYDQEKRSKVSVNGSEYNHNSNLVLRKQSILQTLLNATF